LGGFKVLKQTKLGGFKTLEQGQVPILWKYNRPKMGGFRKMKHVPKIYNRPNLGGFKTIK
jgi:hypothetical protein